MLFQLRLRNGRNRCIVFAAAAFFSGLLFVSSAKAQATTWTVTIDVTSGNPRPVYSVFPKGPTAGCKYVQKDPENLHVCPGDIVQWQAATKNKQSYLRVFLDDPFLLDQDGPTQWFDATDDKPAGGKTNSAAHQGVQHVYSLAVFDKSTNTLFVHDPKIIIGTGSVDDVIREMERDCKELASDSAAPVKNLCNNVQTLITLFHLQ